MTVPKLLPHALSLLCVACATYTSALELQVIGENFSAPVFVTAPPGDTERLFVVDKVGTITIILTDGNVELKTLFLDLSDQVSSGHEQGLLGLAFHPDYDSNGYFFVYYTDTFGVTLVVRYGVSANPNVADESSGMIFLELPQPHETHNAGAIVFRPRDPNHYLYIALGDGGRHHDPASAAQDLRSKLGKILRMDVDEGPGVAPASNPFVDGEGPNEDLIWAYGLRNPWRISFDRDTADMYIGDVGQDRIEEIDFWPSEMPDGGANFGWALLEGTTDGACDLDCDETRENTELPIYEYDRKEGFSVIGGFVYRGADLPSLSGRYVFGDFKGVVWSFAFNGETVSDFRDHTDELSGTNGIFPQVFSFGEDARGELYVCTIDGRVSKIVGPSVTVEQGAAQNDPATELPVLFDVEFSADVTGFSANDVRIDGTAADPEFVVTQIDADSYTISVTSVSSNGTLIATVDAGAAVDTMNDPSSASSSADNTVTTNADLTRPEVSVEQAESQIEATNVFPIVFDVEFSEDVTGFEMSDVDIGGSAMGVTFEVNEIAAATYTIEITSSDTPGTVRPTIAEGAAADGSGNPSAAFTSVDNEVTILAPPVMECPLAAGSGQSLGGLSADFTMILLTALALIGRGRKKTSLNS